MTTGLAGPKPLSAVSKKDVKEITTTLTTLHVGSTAFNKHAILLLLDSGTLSFRQSRNGGLKLCIWTRFLRSQLETWNHSNPVDAASHRQSMLVGRIRIADKQRPAFIIVWIHVCIIGFNLCRLAWHDPFSQSFRPRKLTKQQERHMQRAGSNPQCWDAAHKGFKHISQNIHQLWNRPQDLYIEMLLYLLCSLIVLICCSMVLQFHLPLREVNHVVVWISKP